MQLCLQPVSQPSHSHFRDIPHTGGVMRSMLYLLNDFGIYAVQQACEYRSAGIPDNLEDGSTDQKPHDGVSQRIAQPDPQSANQHRQTGQAIYPGVMAIGHECGTTDFPANFDAKDSHCLLAPKTDYCCGNHSPKIFHILGMKESIHRLI